jgi:hypothetical protein
MSCHVPEQLPTLWEYNKMSLLNIAASLVKVGCSVAINLFIMYSCVSFIPLFVTSIIRIFINDFHGEITCSRADEDLIFFFN